jgi:hypothetical protein
VGRIEDHRIAGNRGVAESHGPLTADYSEDADTLIDELAEGKAMDKILRTEPGNQY